MAYLYTWITQRNQPSLETSAVEQQGMTLFARHRDELIHDTTGHTRKRMLGLLTREHFVEGGHG